MLMDLYSPYMVRVQTAMIVTAMIVAPIGSI